MSALKPSPEGTSALEEALNQGVDAAKVGFDWADAAGVMLKVREELAELQEALDQAGGSATEAVVHELGDLLMALVSLSRKLELSPEAALRSANQRFVSRFQEMEALARARGPLLEERSPTELDALWLEAKGRLAAH